MLSNVISRQALQMVSSTLDILGKISFHITAFGAAPPTSS
jgi:hypothetical protein